ncbi:regulatory protein, luxR family [Nonomuraea solani]|uniref:Regulatory protein, luxR family n=1 Tax=Nonomuraea solani TaxID=1144553 RepID=A0A1H5W6E4_9ACTN|nr:helix-turn-helix transcriptional regulator [Nonomuraea solani]SEF94796.1 regulatory protein, luxR family [Nonomuraea solani]
MLYGRTDELSTIDRMLRAAHDRRSGALIVHGEAGIGKSALLAHAKDSGMAVLETFGVESEAKYPFAGLHLLLRPLLDRLHRLPPRQAAALRSAFGLSPSASQDLFLTGLAALTLLSEHDPGPVLCLVDDLQWLDTASAAALLFAARRLEAEGICMIFSSREDDPAPGIPRMRLGRLPDTAAAELLADRAGGMSAQARRRILDEAAGNPLALLEFSAALTDDRRAGRAGPLPSAVGAEPSPGRVQRAFRARIEDLPEATQLVLLVAAADDMGDAEPILRAAEELGAAADALGPAEQAGLVHVTGSGGPVPGIRFRHPLIRAAAYQGTPHHLRVAAHRALAAVLTGEAHTGRRAWHLATAVRGTDDDVADELERAAVQALDRHDAPAASAALERAAELTTDERTRADRMVRAAELAVRAGHLDKAVALAERAGPLTCDLPIRARADHVLASVEFEHGSPSRAGRILVEGAGRVAAADREAATLMLVDAARHAVFGSDAELARATATAMAGPGPLPAGLMTVAQVINDERVHDLTPVRDAVGHLLETAQDQPAQFLLAASLSLLAGDHTTACRVGAALVARCRDDGLIGVLPPALALLAQAQMVNGRHRDAAEAADEALRVAHDIGQSHRVQHLGGILAWLAAIYGDTERCRTLVAGLDPAVEAGRVMGIWASGLLHLGLGDAREALECLAPLWHGGRRHQTVALYAAPDLIETAVRAGRPDLAVEPLAEFEHWAKAVGTPLMAACAARSRGLLAQGAEAGTHLAEAVRIHDRHADSDQRFERARAELVYGEFLRRDKQRAAAREHLRTAFDLFDLLGTHPWALRAQAELRALGSKAVSTAEGPASLLTPQELQVVRLAADGMANRDIAAHLFLSPRTIEYHLYKAYPKLGVGSRAELMDLELER